MNFFANSNTAYNYSYYGTRAGWLLSGPPRNRPKAERAGGPEGAPARAPRCVFQAKEPLCWSSDLSFFSLRGYFLNVYRALRVCGFASRNNQKMVFIEESRASLALEQLHVCPQHARAIPSQLGAVPASEGPPPRGHQVRGPRGGGPSLAGAKAATPLPPLGRRLSLLDGLVSSWERRRGRAHGAGGLGVPASAARPGGGGPGGGHLGVEEGSGPLPRKRREALRGTARTQRKSAIKAWAKSAEAARQRVAARTGGGVTGLLTDPKTAIYSAHNQSNRAVYCALRLGAPMAAHKGPGTARLERLQRAARAPAAPPADLARWAERSAPPSHSFLVSGFALSPAFGGRLAPRRPSYKGRVLPGSLLAGAVTWQPRAERPPSPFHPAHQNSSQKTAGGKLRGPPRRASCAQAALAESSFLRCLKRQQRPRAARGSAAEERGYRPPGSQPRSGGERLPAALFARFLPPAKAREQKGAPLRGRTRKRVGPPGTPHRYYETIVARGRSQRREQLAKSPFANNLLADVFFFINPEKSPSLVNQASSLKVPTIGVVSGAKGRSRTHQGGVKDPVSFPILGNPASVFFTRALVGVFLAAVQVEAKALKPHFIE